MKNACENPAEYEPKHILKINIDTKLLTAGYNCWKACSRSYEQIILGSHHNILENLVPFRYLIHKGKNYY